MQITKRRRRNEKKNTGKMQFIRYSICSDVSAYTYFSFVISCYVWVSYFFIKVLISWNKFLKGILYLKTKFDRKTEVKYIKTDQINCRIFKQWNSVFICFVSSSMFKNSGYVKKARRVSLIILPPLIPFYHSLLYFSTCNFHSIIKVLIVSFTLPHTAPHNTNAQWIH